ncbi:hypothetical protein V5O48_015934, partial [Marasmius crinis-equi]
MPTKESTGATLEKEQKRREFIFALEKGTPEGPQPDPESDIPQMEPEYGKNSEKMAEIARDYHDDLQLQDMSKDLDICVQVIAEVLQN